MPAATLRDTGALNDSTMGRIGRHAAWAFSRSHWNSTAKGSRTWKAKRFSTVFATPLGVATPLPKTSCMRVPEVRRRLHASVAYCSGACAARLSSPRALRMSPRCAPSTRRTGTRSPTPSSAHQAWLRRLSCVAAPFSCSTNTCSSSMDW